MALLKKLASKTSTTLDDFILSALETPLRLFFVIIGLYLAAVYLPLNAETNIFLSRLFRSALIILVSLGLWNFIGCYGIFAEEAARRSNIKADKTLAPFLSRIIKVIIVLLAITIILQEWNYDINGFVAGLGLGGLAFALAAQQTLANMFGGVVIITDKPFSLGDWILTPSVEGIVEDINFRSTKIRTFADALVTVPNSTLAYEPITNWTRMGKRQITFQIGVPYTTSQEKLQKCVNEIKTMLENHADIHPQTILVNFDSFGNGSFNIFLYFFTITTNWARFLQIKEDVNMKILAILEKEEVLLAFPSAKVYIKNTQGESGS
ncbi:MAG: mechanosensitive ion channel family protein [Syntrophomonadaceae bacterium]|nr:mechanosensitive ion channel family protein [Syntrophomonadaceae bacterium]